MRYILRLYLISLSIIFTSIFILFMILKPYISSSIENFCQDGKKEGAWTYNWLNDPKIVNQFKTTQNCDCLFRHLDF